jgi:hypothetical protein
MLRFKGSQQFRQRLVFATLSGRPIRIDDIRTRDSSPGLRDYEASLLRLLEKCTNGCVVEINETGAHGGGAAGARALHATRPAGAAAPVAYRGPWGVPSAFWTRQTARMKGSCAVGAQSPSLCATASRDG